MIEGILCEIEKSPRNIPLTTKMEFKQMVAKRTT